MTWEKSWCGIREKIREEKKERIGYWRYIEVLFLIHLVLLKRFQWDDSNHTLKDHQMRS
jgi:hypothetical protein